METATPIPTVRYGDLILRWPANWTAIGFLAALGAAHLGIALPAFIHGRWEGFLSLIFGVIFVAAAITSMWVTPEVAVLASRRCVRLRHGLGRFYVERFIPFQSVHGVRLTLAPRRRIHDSRIELLCDNEDIDCPPTTIPRQQALCLAVTIGVQLIKVLCDDDEDAPPRADV